MKVRKQAERSYRRSENITGPAKFFNDPASCILNRMDSLQGFWSGISK